MISIYIALTVNIVLLVGCILPFISKKVLDIDCCLVYIMLSYILIFPSTIITGYEYKDTFPPKQMKECYNKGGVWLKQKSYNHNPSKYTFNCYQLIEVK